MGCERCPGIALSVLLGSMAAVYQLDQDMSRKTKGLMRPFVLCMELERAG